MMQIFHISDIMNLFSWIYQIKRNKHMTDPLTRHIASPMTSKLLLLYDLYRLLLVGQLNCGPHRIKGGTMKQKYQLQEVNSIYTWKNNAQPVYSHNNVGLPLNCRCTKREKEKRQREGGWGGRQSSVHWFDVFSSYCRSFIESNAEVSCSMVQPIFM